MTMKPEIRIALVKEVEQAKRVLSSEYPTRWVRLGYVGAVLATLFGITLLTFAIGFIVDLHVRQVDHIIGSLLVLMAFIFIVAPWYFLVRYSINRKVKLLCEAILSVSQFDGYIAS
jgi:hypothetical protein